MKNVWRKNFRWWFSPILMFVRQKFPAWQTLGREKLLGDVFAQENTDELFRKNHPWPSENRPSKTGLVANLDKWNTHLVWTLRAFRSRISHMRHIRTSRTHGFRRSIAEGTSLLSISWPDYFLRRCAGARFSHQWLMRIRWWVRGRGIIVCRDESRQNDGTSNDDGDERERDLAIHGLTQSSIQTAVFFSPERPV